MLHILYGWFWWTSTLGMWSYFYTVSTTVFSAYYGYKFVRYLFFSSKHKKKRSDQVFYSSSASLSEEEEEEERMSDTRQINNKTDNAEKHEHEEGGNATLYFDPAMDSPFSIGGNSTFSSGSFRGRAPKSFDALVSMVIRWTTYFAIGLLLLFTLIITGGVLITFLDKLQEERQIRSAYYQAVNECRDKQIQSEKIVNACRHAMREYEKSSLFGAIKKTFFEMVKSLDDCVWYLKSSPAAWLLLALGLFLFGCKILWPDRNENFPRYLKWLQRAGIPVGKSSTGLRRRHDPQSTYTRPASDSVYGHSAQIQIPNNGPKRVTPVQRARGKAHEH